ncbi:MAG: DUF2264 domain-containing protein [Spirochaetaceae bacterium]|nr:MAG: DUF2264 domain-containing protein [Spirochaetaceae bacterium]
MAVTPFSVANPDSTRSPLTGMSRTHWIEAGRFLLNRYEPLFDHGRNEYLPFAPEDRTSLSARFELFTRLALLVLPLFRADPTIRVGSTENGGLPVDEWLERSLCRYCSTASPDWIGFPGEGKSPFQLVQWAGLVVALMLGPDGLWESLPVNLREEALENLARCVAHRTNAHNWRFFNVLGTAFLARHGVPVDEDAEREHLEQLLCWYAGDGWYRDGHDFDYYNAWAFQPYFALWASLPRSKAYPDIRSRAITNFHDFIDSYIRMFTREGHSLLWGRSALYRFAACTPLVYAFFLDDPRIAGGVARRICSGNLLQFLHRSDMWDGGVPTLGYYRSFPSVVQRYSRTTSFGWMHKAFGCLALADESPFWSRQEENAPWYKEKPSGAGRTMIVLDGPGIGICNDPATGDVMIITGKVRSAEDPCYNRLAYFGNHLLEGATPDPPASLSYEATTTAHSVASRLTVSRIRYAGACSGVVYRQIYLGPLNGHHSDGILIDLADVVIPGGLLRVDRVRSSFPHTLWLGGHSVRGHVDLETTRYDCGTGYELHGAHPDSVRSVMIPLAGWSDAKAIHRSGTHAEFPLSTCLALSRTVTGSNVGSIALVAAIIADAPMPASAVPRVVPRSGDGAAGLATGAKLTFPDGRSVTVSFEGIEGRLRE